MECSQDFNMNDNDVKDLRVKLRNKAIRKARVNFSKKEKSNFDKKDSCLLSGVLLKGGTA